MRRCFSLLSVAAAGLSLLSARATAEPLAKEECDKLKGEQAELISAGAKDQLGRGAAWGKANLTPEQVKRVERYIAVDEQLSFRCGVGLLRATLPVIEEGGEQELDEKGQPIPPKDKGAQPVSPHAKPKTVAPKATTAPAKAAAAAPKAPKSPPEAKGKAEPAAAKAKPKAKPDDAYRPPVQGNPQADPFAGTRPAGKE
jgi:hypothetical protein